MVENGKRKKKCVPTHPRGVPCPNFVKQMSIYVKKLSTEQFRKLSGEIWRRRQACVNATFITPSIGLRRNNTTPHVCFALACRRFIPPDGYGAPTCLLPAFPSLMKLKSQQPTHSLTPLTRLCSAPFFHIAFIATFNLLPLRI